VVAVVRGGGGGGGGGGVAVVKRLMHGRHDAIAIMTKSRPDVVRKPTYKAPRKAIATRAVAKPSSPKLSSPKASDIFDGVKCMVMPEGFQVSQLSDAERLSGAVREMTVAECDLKQLVKLFDLVADQSMWTTRELRDVFVNNLDRFRDGIVKAFFFVDLHVATIEKSAQVQGSVGDGRNGSKRTEVGQPETEKQRRARTSIVLSDSSCENSEETSD